MTSWPNTTSALLPWILAQRKLNLDAVMQETSSMTSAQQVPNYFKYDSLMEKVFKRFKNVVLIKIFECLDCMICINIFF